MDTLKNTLTTHISRIFVILLHFFNDVNLKTLSCYIVSMLSKHLLVTFFHSLGTHLKNPQGLSNSRPSLAGPFHAPSLAGGMGQVAARQSQQQKQFKNHTKIQTDFLQKIEMHTRKAVET